MSHADMHDTMCEVLRIPRKFMAGTLRESEVRSALVPDADLRHEYDEAMKLVHALTYACMAMREERDGWREMTNKWEQEAVVTMTAALREAK